MSQRQTFLDQNDIRNLWFQKCTNYIINSISSYFYIKSIINKIDADCLSIYPSLPANTYTWKFIMHAFLEDVWLFYWTFYNIEHFLIHGLNLFLFASYLCTLKRQTSTFFWLINFQSGFTNINKNNHVRLQPCLVYVLIPLSTMSIRICG